MTARAPARLLVVDDDAAAVSLLAEVFDREGFKTHSATSVQGALEQLRSVGAFDLVLTDLRMPGGSGLDLLKVICDRYPATIVIVLTAFGDTAAAAEAIRAGALRFHQQAVRHRGAPADARPRPRSAGSCGGGDRAGPLARRPESGASWSATAPAIIEVMKTDRPGSALPGHRS